MLFPQTAIGNDTQVASFKQRQRNKANVSVTRPNIVTPLWKPIKPTLEDPKEP